MNAIIVAGGLGLRLRPLTNDLPKCMVKVLGKPLIGHVTEWLRENGFREVLFALGYKWEAVRDYFKDGRGFGVAIRYSIEPEPLGDAGAVRYALSRGDLGDEVLVVNGDIITDLKLERMLQYHLKARQKGGLATVAVGHVPYPYGVLSLTNGGRVVRIAEKPMLPVWTSIGIYMLADEALDELPEKGNLAEATLPKLAERGQLYAYKANGAFWRTVDDVKNLQDVEHELQRREQAALARTEAGFDGEEALLLSKAR
ncbi:MAG: nucleotidyltransferase family protein [Candidatus Bathyarchaeia archaeon]